MDNIILPDKIRIGTRGSRLALAQTQIFIDMLHEKYPEIQCQVVIIKTTGDRILDKPLLEFGGKAVFVNEFEEAIRDGRIDYAVHSAKDMPMELLEGLDIVCVLPREDARDVLITRKGCHIEHMGSAVIGTGSLRRQFQVRELYHNVECTSLRGNVTTRLEKLRAGEYDGIILAAAGIKRLGLHQEQDLEYRYFSSDEIVPAAGQGIIAIEGMGGHKQHFLEAIDDRRARRELLTERQILKQQGAGCHEPIGVFAEASDNREYINISIMTVCDGKVIRQEEKWEK